MRNKEQKKKRRRRRKLAAAVTTRQDRGGSLGKNPARGANKGANASRRVVEINWGRRIKSLDVTPSILTHFPEI